MFRKCCTGTTFNKFTEMSDPELVKVSVGPSSKLFAVN